MSSWEEEQEAQDQISEYLAQGVRRHRIVRQVQAERFQQDAKFGEQWTLPLVREPHNRVRYAYHAEDWKYVNGPTAQDYAGMLLEEVYEALAEADPGKMREELIQVMAVTMKMIEKIDREAEQR